MTIGIIGIGVLTMEIARRSAEAGYSVFIHHPCGNSLVRETIEKMDSHIKLGSLEQAATASIIVLFAPKDNLETVLKSLPDMTGKIIVHTSSLIFDPQSLLSGVTRAFTYTITTSLLPTAYVVKLFKPINLQTIISNAGTYRDEIYYIADHRASRSAVKTFLNKLQFSALDLSNRLKRTATTDLQAGSNPVIFLAPKNYIN